MHKTLLAIILLSLTMTHACGVINDSKGGESLDNIDFVKSKVAKETSPQVDSGLLKDLAQDNTKFALAFYSQINDGDDNIIFSPISISLALSMALAGAESSTEQGMIDALSLTIPETDVYPAFNALMLAIEESQSEMQEDVKGNTFQLNIANSIWGQAGFPFKETFLDTLARYYGTGLYNVDYSADPEAARLAINDWVEKETKEKIKDLIPQGAINSLTRLVLANAIYFKGSWRYPFSKTDTIEAPFTILDSSQTLVDMMMLSGEYLRYARLEEAQAIQLPYLSPDFSMIIIVPDLGVFESYEADWSYEKLEFLRNKLSMTRVDLQMPKFEMTTSTDAKDPLKTLGMDAAFNMDIADFSGMTDIEELFITEVLHKATITVDEEGTEAAAATAVIMALKSAMPTEPISLIIDRPFLFLIEHQPTGTILFMGRVTHP